MHDFIKFSNEFKLMAQKSDFRSVAVAKLNDQNIGLYWDVWYICIYIFPMKIKSQKKVSLSIVFWFSHK